MSGLTRLWLSIQQGNESWSMGTSGDLYVREVAMVHLPDVGDSVFVISSEDDPTGTMELEVRKRYWDIDGTANLEMQHIIVDPIQRVQDWAFAYRSGGGPNQYTSWYTERDGTDLVERVTEHWTPYGEWVGTHG